MKKRAFPTFLAIFTLLILVVCVGSRFSQTVDPQAPPALVFAGKEYWRVEMAATEEERSLGLGERDRLPAGRAMLFTFPRADYHGFWMKGMRFPIDIVYLRMGKIVSLERNVQPDDLRIMYPSVPADQVLEMNAGEAAELERGSIVWYWRGFW